jgi:hypothetical protein
VLALQRRIGNRATTRLIQRAPVDEMLALTTYEDRFARIKTWIDAEHPALAVERAKQLQAHFATRLADFKALDEPTRNAIAQFMLKYLPDRQARQFYEEAGEELKDVATPSVKRLLQRGRDSGERFAGTEYEELVSFAAEFGYFVPEKIYTHEIFNHDTLTVYPQERTFVQGKAKTKAEEVYRPILDLERVGGKWYGRCYLALFAMAPASSGRKDITADPEGEVTITNAGLMNLGNPFKALLWVEDYLKNKEHGHGASPVIRSWLIPLEDVRWMLTGDQARPLDRDRGSGQFGNLGEENLYSNNLTPLKGSLVSFFVDPEQAGKAEPNQKKLPMSLLQHFLTGTGGDPRQMAKGIAAQHGRAGHQAEFTAPLVDALTAYYDALSDTGFAPKTAADPIEVRANPKSFALTSVSLDEFEYMKEEKKRHPPNT